MAVSVCFEKDSGYIIFLCILIFFFESLPKVLQYIKLLGKDPLSLVLKFGPLHD